MTNGKTKTTTSSKPSAKPSKPTKKRKSKAETEAPKKRKRIVAVIDSESSDDDGKISCTSNFVLDLTIVSTLSDVVQW